MGRAMEVRMWVGWERRWEGERGVERGGGGGVGLISNFPLSMVEFSMIACHNGDPIINCSMDVEASRHLCRCLVLLPRRMMVLLGRLE